MLYLIRHAKSEQEFLRLPGDQRPPTREEWRLDHGLSERGRLEAALLHQRLARLEPPDRVLASPRLRALETAALTLPGVPAQLDERLHEWCEDESVETLLSRARWLLAEGETGTTFAFTHGNFIRAVLAALIVREDLGRFEATFHDLRRMLHIWNVALTVIGHGGSGLEVLGVNLHPEIDALAGRP